LKTSIVGAIYLAVACQTALAKDILFDKVFAEGLLHPVRETVLIQVDDDSVLVFPAMPPVYYLEGKNLVISAKTIRLDGSVVLSSFSKSAAAHIEAANPGTDQASKGHQRNCGSNPGDNGDDGGRGTDGVDGNPGARGGVVFLQASKVDGVGTLTIDNTGQNGGKGQTSGRGGTGGGGGKGCDRECGSVGGPSGHGSGDGGTGGTGGWSGLPGLGGQGGDGGVVRYSPAIADQLDKKIIVKTTSGSIGNVGDFGKRGLRGNKGAGGAAANCDLQGMIGGGRDGEDGKDGGCGALLGTPGESPLLASCPAPTPVPNAGKIGVSEAIRELK